MVQLADETSIKPSLGSGFTRIEFSTVLVIIGMIVCGALVWGNSCLGQPQIEAREARLVAKKITIHEWFPPGFRQGNRQWPLIIFSHGFKGCAIQSIFLTDALAAHGYVVLAPDHADAACNELGESQNTTTEDETGKAPPVSSPSRKISWAWRLLFGGGLPENSALTPDRWTDEIYKVRADEIRYTLDYILADPKTGPFIDKNRIGLAGHSLGGYTVLGLAGGWASWKDPRFKAVLAMSPYATTFTAQHTLRGIGVPIMYQGGTQDIVPTLGVNKQDDNYDQTPVPKYLVVLQGAGHLAWTDTHISHHDLINHYALAFFDKYLLGRDNGLLASPPGQGVSDYRAAP